MRLKKKRGRTLRRIICELMLRNHKLNPIYNVFGNRIGYRCTICKKKVILTGYVREVVRMSHLDG